MSASDIANLDTSVSTDGTDLTKLSAEELLAVVAELRQENKTLLKSKNKVGLTFKRIPEDGNESLIRLENGEFPYLTKNESLSVVKDGVTDGNIALIEGENLAVLAALQMTHKNKVDVIYIDPPYNTGNDDFIYEDKRMYKSDAGELEGLEETLDGKVRTVGKDDPFRHSKWLSFMERRLFLARELLNDTGVIFVSIDDNEQARLKLLMDSIFGGDNFVDTIIWEKTYSTRNDAKHFSRSHDFILVYRKSDKWIRSLLPRTEKANAHYKYDDNNSRGKYRTGDISVARNTPTSVYGVTNPKSGKEFFPPKGRAWSVSPSKIQELIDDNRIYWGKDGMGGPQIKRYLAEVQNGIVPQTIWKYDVVGHTDEGAKEVKTIVGGGAFDYPKPVRLIQQIIQLHPNKQAIVLDFFAGSGTTGHAVAELNKEDGGNRSAILVTNNEAGIARNVTRERLARVLTGKNWADGKERDALPGDLSFYEMDLMKLPSNPLTVAQMMEKKFDAILSLENNTLNLVEEDTNEDFAIYDNSDTLTLVWKNFFSLYDGEFEDILDSIKVKFPSKRLVAYVPSELEDTDMEAEGWEIISFPHDYINRYNAMIATMRRNQTLPNAK